MVTLASLTHHLRWVVPISRWTPVLGLLGVLLSLLIWRRLAARLDWRPRPTLVALLSLLLTLALTLSPRGWRGNHRSLRQCLPDDWADFATSVARVGASLESWLNIVMLVPLGVALVLASRRVLWPAVAVVLLPAGIELGQIVVAGRQCSTADWIANALGGVVGVLAGAVVARRRDRPGKPSVPCGSMPSER